MRSNSAMALSGAIEIKGSDIGGIGM